MKSATVLCAGVSFFGSRFDVAADLRAWEEGGVEKIGRSVKVSLERWKCPADATHIFVDVVRVLQRKVRRDEEEDCRQFAFSSLHVAFGDVSARARASPQTGGLQQRPCERTECALTYVPTHGITWFDENYP